MQRVRLKGGGGGGGGGMLVGANKCQSGGKILTRRKRRGYVEER